jgi:hypothetical protein
MLMTSQMHAIILGVVEGITEFLPVSSTGHLIVLTDLLQFRETGGTCGIGIQVGAVMAVLWFYRFYSPPLLPRARFEAPFLFSLPGAGSSAVDCRRGPDSRNVPPGYECLQSQRFQKRP